jgi:hypothetical protein
MSISDATESAILKLVFQAVAWANYADNAASSPQTNVGIALHTADPADAGTASTSEMTTAAYTGYTRVNVLRNATGWGISGTSPTTISPAANIDFPAGSGGTGATASFFSTSSSNAAPPTGAAAILWSGAISPTIACGNGVTPRLTTASTITLD